MDVLVISGFDLLTGIALPPWLVLIRMALGGLNARIDLEAGMPPKQFQSALHIKSFVSRFLTESVDGRHQLWLNQLLRYLKDSS